MIKSLTAINYLGESVKINLSEGYPEHGMVIKSIEGLGPPKASLGITDLAVMDGSKINSAKVDKRNIVIGMLLTFAPTVEDSRQRTYKYFPIKKEVQLQIETDNRTVVTYGVVESNTPDIFSKEESNSISIICEEPYFYSYEDNETIFLGTDPLFEFPFSNESLDEPLIEFGSIVEESTEKIIHYNGDVETGVIINIHAIGEVGSIKIYNVETREVMSIDVNKIDDLTGSKIVTGDEIIISTIKGNKYIKLLRNGYYTNILNALDKESDWFQLSKGNNVFVYKSDFGTENMQFTITNKVLYEGV